MTREQETATRIIAVLEQGVSELDASICSQLADARAHAVAAAAVPVRHAETVHAGMGRLLIEHLHLHNQRVWMPVLLLSAALMAWVVLHQMSGEPVEADALLLASELPPEAYLDKGFDAWLENSSQL